MTKKFTAFILGIMATVGGIFPSTVFDISASAEETGNLEYTEVLEDLETDEKFDTVNYPKKTSDYSLSVIQIAESVNDELFLYVYQPSDAVKELTATKVLFSTAINENFSPQLYDLTLVHTDGVFDKYKVEDFTVKEDAVRYYSIVRLQRTFDTDIDTPSGTDNEIVEVSEEVGQLWTACTIDGKVTYDYIYTETIEITDKWTGFLRYHDGFKLYIGACDSWFIAFNTDKRIEKLTGATVGYTARTYGKYVYLNQDKQGSVEYGEPKYASVDLSDMDTVKTEADGLFGKTYKWNRIESVETFEKETTLTDEAKKQLEGKQWVLRFLETEYTQSLPSNGLIYKTGTEVGEETILRLQFETAGNSYNLGVVDNEQTPDETPDNKPDIDTTLDEMKAFLKMCKELWAWLKSNWKWLAIAAVALIVGVPLIIAFLPSIIRFVVLCGKGLIKLLWWLVIGIAFVIASPVLLLIWIIKGFISLFKKE